MLSLDHAGAIVRDLAAGAARWERLGFALSPLSRQRGKLPGRDEDGPWATANRCAVFRQGYLELIGIVDPDGFNPWARFLDRFEGLHLLALRVPDADAAFAELAGRTGALNPPVQRERRLDVDGTERSMRFRNIFSRDECHPEGRYIVLEHQTPEYLWQPRYMSHPNGALGLEAVLICAADVPAQRARLESILGRPGADGPEGVLRFALDGGGLLELHGAKGFEQRHGWIPPALPGFAGVRIRFAARDRAARLMEDNEVGVMRSGRDWFVAPGAANGFVMEMAG